MHVRPLEKGVAGKPGWKVVDLEGDILERRHSCGLLDREQATHSAIIGPRTPEQLDSYLRGLSWSSMT